MVLLIHGDAAFAGEGIVQETLNLSQLPGYQVGGALHVIVNNQIGFTTSPQEGRSTTYASDVAKMLQSPIFHVNGENPEAVAQVVDLAMDFRRQFHRDVVIDMYCYRRWGHNESDEPAFTQPRMYAAIGEQQSVRDDYLEHLLTLGDLRKFLESHRDAPDDIPVTVSLPVLFNCDDESNRWSPDHSSPDFCSSCFCWSCFCWSCCCWSCFCSPGFC